jgi:hypothetical protein
VLRDVAIVGDDSEQHLLEDILGGVTVAEQSARTTDDHCAEARGDGGDNVIFNSQTPCGVV